MPQRHKVVSHENESMTTNPFHGPLARPILTLAAEPEPITIDAATTAVLVIDMQNDFGSKGGMFDRAGIDISMIHRAVGPTAQVLASAQPQGNLVQRTS